MENHVNFDYSGKGKSSVLKGNLRIRVDAVKTSETSQESLLKMGSPEVFFCKNNKKAITANIKEDERTHQRNVIKCISKSCAFECHNLDDLDKHFQDAHFLKVCLENKCPVEACGKSFDTKYVSQLS